MNDLAFSQNCLTVLTNLACEKSPEISSHKIGQEVEKSTCFPVFLKVTEHIAVWFPWLSNELNRVGQPNSIEYKMVDGLSQAMFRT